MLNMSWPVPDFLACHPTTHFSAHMSSERALTFGFPSLTTVYLDCSGYITNPLPWSDPASSTHYYLLSQLLSWSVRTQEPESSLPWLLCVHTHLLSPLTVPLLVLFLLALTEVTLGFWGYVPFAAIMGSASYTQVRLHCFMLLKLLCSL